MIIEYQKVINLLDYPFPDYISKIINTKIDNVKDNDVKNSDL